MIIKILTILLSLSSRISYLISTNIDIEESKIEALFQKLEKDPLKLHETEIESIYSSNMNSSAINNLMGALYLSRNNFDRAVDYFRYIK